MQKLKNLAAEEAVSLIQSEQTVAIGGFTAAGTPKKIISALSKKAIRKELPSDFKINLLSGASTGKWVDGELAQAGIVNWRTCYQADPLMRAAINEEKVHFYDMNVSSTPQFVNYRFIDPVDWAIIEVVDFDEEGNVLLSTGVGSAMTFCRAAKKILLEVNTTHSKSLKGMHDLYETKNPPHRREIPIYKASDRIGSPTFKIDPKKIVGYVISDIPDAVNEFTPSDSIREKIGNHVANFLLQELKASRIPQGFLPIQAGVGNVSNAVLEALGMNSEIPAFEMYSEVIQDSIFELLQKERIRFASTTALTASPGMLKTIYENIDFFRSRLVLRPQEISNHPEIIRRLGVISINTAIEVDIFGHVNSSHVLGQKIMNGVGGSCDFTQNSYISMFTCPSTTKEGKISSVVPFCSHIDHTEHGVQIIVTEHGVADLRGKDPKQRAETLISQCAAPEYRDLLHHYLSLGKGHMPHSLQNAFAFHRSFSQSGDMKNAQWSS